MDDLGITLPIHEAHSEARAEQIIAAVQHQQQEHQIMSDGQHDKVEVKNIFEPGKHGGGEGMGGLGTAAVIAAMGNRNEGGGAAAMLPALMAGRGHDGLGGFGAGLIGGVLGGLLFGGRRGGLFGGDEGGSGGVNQVTQDIFGTAVLTKLGSIEAAIPLAQANTENVILQQTNTIGSALGSLALGVQQGLAGVKDTVQNTTALVLAQGAAIDRDVLTEACSIKQVVAAENEKTRTMLAARWTQEDQTKITTLANKVIELENENRHNERSRGLEIQITNTNTAQAQAVAVAVAQNDERRWSRLESLLVNQHNDTRQGIVNLGTMTGSGTQASNSTNLA